MNVNGHDNMTKLQKRYMKKKRDNQWNVHKKVESNVRCNEHVYKEKK